MNILILGGSHFVGFHIASAILAAGHSVSLFNRGRSNAKTLPGAEQLIGDRDGDLTALENRCWDIAIDVSGYLPRLVNDSVTVLRGQVKQYIFISTASVYDEQKVTPNIKENGPLETLTDNSTETIDDNTYGGLKVLCEQAVIKGFKNKSLVLRLGLMAGPHEKFPERLYWIRRVSLGGGILVPTVYDRYFNFIDVRDVADFILTAINESLSGIYNVGGSAQMTLQCWLAACQQACQSNTDFIAIDNDAFLREHDVYQGIAFSDRHKVLDTCNDKAIKAGLRYRPLVETASDILAWDKAQSPRQRQWAGLSKEKEEKLLLEWAHKPVQASR